MFLSGCISETTDDKDNNSSQNNVNFYIAMCQKINNQIINDKNINYKNLTNLKQEKPSIESISEYNKGIINLKKSYNSYNQILQLLKIKSNSCYDTYSIINFLNLESTIEKPVVSLRKHSILATYFLISSIKK